MQNALVYIEPYQDGDFGEFRLVFEMNDTGLKSSIKLSRSHYTACKAVGVPVGRPIEPIVNPKKVVNG